MLTLLLLAAVAMAGEIPPPVDVFNVPSFTENGSDETITKKNLDRDTVVQMDPFTVAIPRGWTFLAAGHSVKMTGSLTATPSSNIEKDETYFGLNERRDPPLYTIEERAQKIKREKKDWKTHFDEWNNAKWLVAEYIEKDKNSKAETKHWACFTVAHNTEYWILAGTPAAKQKEMEPVLLNIMKSAALRGVAIEGSTVAVATKKTVPAVDQRLQDKWTITSYKLSEVPALWTEDEAKDMVGKTIVFDGNHIQIGKVSCETTAKPVVDPQEEHTLLQDANNPCSEAVPGGPIFNLTRKHCSKKTSFPPYLTFESTDGVVAFGDEVSFCLKRTKAQ